MLNSARLLLLLVLSAALTACATRYDLAEDYGDRIGQDGSHSSGQTVIFFLIDGLQAAMLQREMQAGHLPQLQAYFLPHGGGIGLARTIFPSLTFPAIGSLLTQRPVDRTGLIGNQIVSDGRIVNFEDPAGHPELNRMIGGMTVFDRLRARNLRSVSLDYAFHTGSTAHTDARDVKAGVAILNHEYAYVDDKTLDSLDLLLKKTPTTQWPDFIFVHLVGVDFTSHDAGPDAPEVLDVLAEIDGRLAPIFRRLDNGERAGHKVITMLSSDHGFDREHTRTVNLEGALQRVAKGVSVLDEGRYMSLSFPSEWTAVQRADFIMRLSQIPDVDMAAVKNGNRVVIRSQGDSTDLDYLPEMDCGVNGFGLTVRDTTAGPTLARGAPGQCADRLDAATNSLYYPYFISNLAHYFHAQSAPDAIVIAKPGVGFNSKYRGQHGGPTQRELLVPLLLHGARVKDGSVPALSELLDIL